MSTRVTGIAGSDAAGTPHEEKYSAAGGKGLEVGAKPHRYWQLEQNTVREVDGGVIEESLLDIYVNGQELATLMCSPLEQESLALGFLFGEGVIDSLEDVALLQANRARSVVDVFLTRAEFDPPRRMVLTSGCGGGLTLQRITAREPPLESDFVIEPARIPQRMRELQGAARLYRLVRGVHTAVLAGHEHLLLVAEDVGRHNAIDKIAGKALQAGIETHNRLLLSSGRISSEMLARARRMSVPLVASRTAPTSTALQLAEAWRICVVGYVRRGGMRVYTHAWRLGLGGKGGIFYHQTH